MPLLALDQLHAIAAEHGTVIRLRRHRGAGRQWVASIDNVGAAAAATVPGAVRALADKLAPRPLALCQREESHG